MSKRLVAKLTVTVAALSVITLLQGCSKEVDDTVLKTAWAPVGTPGTATAPTTTTTTTAAGGGGTAQAAGTTQ